MISGLDIQVVLLHIILDIRVRGLPLHDKAQLFHLGDGHLVARQLLLEVLGDNAQERVSVERPDVEVSRAGRGQKAEVHDSVPDPVAHVIICSLEDLDLDGGIRLPEGLDDIGHPARADTGEHAHFYSSLFEAVELRHRLLQALLAVEDRVHIGHQVLSVARQRDACFLPCKNRETELLFHRRNGVADGGRGQPYEVRRLMKASRLRDGLEYLITEKSHWSPPY